jgi:hypothetical protein
MNMSTQRGSRDELPEPLKSVIESIAGAQLDESRMDSYLSALKERRLVQKSPRSYVASKLIRRPVLIWLASTAALVAIVFGLQFLPTASALEQIASSLANVRCIKSTIIVDGVESERWLMPKENRSATRNKQWIDFADGPSNRLLTYDRINGEFVQSTLPERVASTFDTDLIESLAGLGVKNGRKTIVGMAVESSEVKTVDGKRVLKLVLRKETMSGSARITLQDNGNLPVFGVVQFSRDGLSQTIETTWEYPQTGPADIFALGVSKDTTLIDRIPTPAVKQLVADVYKGRLQFDDYRAVVFATDSERLNDVGTYRVSLVSKKANRLVLLRNADRLVALEGQSQKEVAAQILADPKMIKWVPASLIDGGTHYFFRDDTAGGFYTTRSSDVAEGFTIPGAERVPHLVGRPPTGIGLPTMGATLELSADGIPSDCVLLRTNQTIKNESLQNPVQQFRDAEYWISRTKDFLVLRTQHRWEDGSTSVLTLGDLVQSPSGYWYPQSVSRSRVDSSDRPVVQSYHVDFTAPLSDAMFDLNDLVKMQRKAKPK